MTNCLSFSCRSLVYNFVVIFQQLHLPILVYCFLCFLCFFSRKVISEQTIVSEVTFQDGARGTSSVVGQFFATSDARRRQARENRDATLQQGEKKEGIKHWSCNSSLAAAALAAVQANLVFWRC
jgi:hypothetical protein